MSKYQYYKELIRDEAIEWQQTTAQEPMSQGEHAYWTNYFYTKGKRYGLLKEFEENGIC